MGLLTAADMDMDMEINIEDSTDSEGITRTVIVPILAIIIMEHLAGTAAMLKTGKSHKLFNSNVA